LKKEKEKEKFTLIKVNPKASLVFNKKKLFQIFFKIKIIPFQIEQLVSN
jgi:hypothetical protein